MRVKKIIAVAGADHTWSKQKRVERFSDPHFYRYGSFLIQEEFKAILAVYSKRLLLPTQLYTLGVTSFQVI